MRKGGVGGANTRTGAAYEKNTDLVENFQHNGLKVVPCKTIDGVNEVHDNDTLVGYHGKQASLYAYLDSLHVSYAGVNAVKYRPDEWFYNITAKEWTIVEKKNQDGNGSTIQKLFGTGGFLFCYRRVIDKMNDPEQKVKIIYQLSSWHDNPKHRDYFDYWKSENINWYFTDIPMSEFGLNNKLPNENIVYDENIVYENGISCSYKFNENVTFGNGLFEFNT